MSRYALLPTLIACLQSLRLPAHDSSGMDRSK